MIQAELRANKSEDREEEVQTELQSAMRLVARQTHDIELKTCRITELELALEESAIVNEATKAQMRRYDDSAKEADTLTASRQLQDLSSKIEQLSLALAVGVLFETITILATHSPHVARGRRHKSGTSSRCWRDMKKYELQMKLR